MSALAKHWKLVLGVVLLLAALLIFFGVYRIEKAAYESEHSILTTSINALNSSIAENVRYAGVQDELEDALGELQASRLALYEHFPVELREEDQIMYVLYLEQMFGTEISFSFSFAAPITALYDGAALAGVTLTVNYETTYQGFKDMVEYIATDSRIASVQYATMNYDEEADAATGTITITLYVMQSDLLEYRPPNVAQPDAGKDNIFD